MVCTYLKIWKAGDLDSTTRNVVQEIMRECSNRGIPVTEGFVIYYVKLLMLTPTWGITADSLPIRNDVQHFVKHCIHKLEHQTCAFMVTLKMQLYFMSNFGNVEQIVIKNRMDLKTRLAPLEKEILETESTVKSDVDKLYRKVVFLVTLGSGLGNPTTKSVYNEAEAALRSIFLDSDLREFMDQTYWNKQMQLVELTELVTGIRLFNRDSQKSGVGIEDLPKLLSQAIDTTNTDVQKSLRFIMDNVNMFTTAIDNCFKISEDDKQGYVLTAEQPVGVSEDNLEYVKDLLVVYRQYELFVRKILVELGQLEKLSNKLFNNLKDAFVRLHDTVRYKIAIPTIQVFPLFSDVARIWCQLQDQTIALSQLNQILLNLQMLTRDLIVNDEALKSMVGHEGPITDTERLERTTGLVIEPMEADVEVLDPGNIKDFDKLELQYLGFCAWKFVETDGGLIPGNPNMGVANVHDMHYIFSSPEAATAFGKNAARYVLRALELARNKPELIYLLQLDQQLIAVREIEELVVEIPEVIETYDNGMQTDVHPIPTRIDPQYMWNVWDWKRQAIMLANLSRRMTHSTQTVKSNARNAVKTQTQKVEDFGYQTKKDNYTNVPTLANFIYGLRGRKDDTQHVITLTRPVDE